MDQFHSKFIENLARFLIFLLSSLFTILIIFSILNENILLHLYITPEKTALWYIGIIVTAITLLKGLVNEKIIFYPKEKMKELRGDLQYLPQRFETDNDVIKIKKEFSNYFQYKVVILIKDLYYTLLVPFDLYKISYDVDRIVYFYQKNTLRHNKIGRTFKLSLFDNIFGLQNQRGDDKTVHSFNNFKNIYEDWYQDLASLQTSMNIA
jgi:autophagy-related protein 9